MMSHYKIVRRKPDSSLVSMAIHEPAAQVTYLPGEWLRAQKMLAQIGYHLLVYTDRERVVDIVQTMQRAQAPAMRATPPFEIWKCHVRGILVDLPEYIDFIELARFFAGEAIPLSKRLPPRSWGPSAVMVVRVRLIERLDLSMMMPAPNDTVYTGPDPFLQTPAPDFQFLPTGWEGT